MPDETARIPIMNAIPVTAVLGEHSGKFCGSLMTIIDNREKRRELPDSSRTEFRPGDILRLGPPRASVTPRTGKLLRNVRASTRSYSAR